VPGHLLDGVPACSDLISVPMSTSLRGQMPPEEIPEPTRGVHDEYLMLQDIASPVTLRSIPVDRAGMSI
jgi:hypothetical protein